MALAGDAIHRRFLQHRGAQVRMMRHEGARVDGGSACDIQQMSAPAEIQSLGSSLRQEDAAAIHGCGELLRKGIRLHGFMPVVQILNATPVGWMIGFQDSQNVLRYRAIFQWTQSMARGTMVNQPPDVPVQIR